jgi:hypothetical protein
MSVRSAMDDNSRFCNQIDQITTHVLDNHPSQAIELATILYSQTQKPAITNYKTGSEYTEACWKIGYIATALIPKQIVTRDDRKELIGKAITFADQIPCHEIHGLVLLDLAERIKSCGDMESVEKCIDAASELPYDQDPIREGIPTTLIPDSMHTQIVEAYAKINQLKKAEQVFKRISEHFTSFDLATYATNHKIKTPVVRQCWGFFEELSPSHVKI